MAYFDKGASRGGGKRDFRPGGGKPYNYKDSQPKVMHTAVCADCGKSCEVPFRPTGDRPVYCRDCFQNHEAPSNDRYPKKERRDFAPSAPRFVAPPSNGGNEELKKQLESVNAKLERLITAVQSLK